MGQKIYSLLIITLLLNLLTNPLTSPIEIPINNNNWTSLSLPLAKGGNTLSIAISPSTPIIMYSLIEGDQGWRFFGSIDGGLSWQEKYIFLYTTNNNLKNIIVDPNDPKIIYVNGIGGVQRSIDGGTTWVRISPIGEVFNLVSSNILYAGGGSELCQDSVNKSYDFTRSDDGGKNWSSITLGCLDALEQIAVIPSQPNVIYLSILRSGNLTGEILKSTDEGQSWTSISLPFEGASTELLIDPNNPQRLFGSGAEGIIRSNDGGNSWQQISSKNMGTYFRLVLTSDYLFAIKETNYQTPVFRSGDNGSTWWVSQNLLPAGVAKLLVDPFHSGCLWAGLIGYGIYFSESDGGFWVEHNDGIQTQVSINHLAISESDKNVIYASSDYPYPDIYRTIDGGQSWSIPLLRISNARTKSVSIFNHFPSTNPYSSSNNSYSILEIRKILVDPKHPEIAWAATNNGIYETIDGVNWQEKLSNGEGIDLTVSDAAPDQPYAAMYSPQLNQKFLAQRRCTLEINQCNWISFITDNKQVSLGIIRVDQNNPFLLLTTGNVNTVSGEAIGIFQSLSGGISWVQIGQINEFESIADLSIAPNNNHIMTIILADYWNKTSWLLRSLDGGITWQDWSTGAPVTYGWEWHLAMDDLGSAYLGSLNGVYERKYSQTEWVPFGLQDKSIRALAYQSGSAPILLAASDNGLWRLELSPFKYNWLPIIENISVLNN